jgi:hypothetical protein
MPYYSLETPFIAASTRLKSQNNPLFRKSNFTETYPYLAYYLLIANLQAKSTAQNILPIKFEIQSNGKSDTQAATANGSPIAYDPSALGTPASTAMFNAIQNAPISPSEKQQNAASIAERTQEIPYLAEWDNEKLKAFVEYGYGYRDMPVDLLNYQQETVGRAYHALVLTLKGKSDEATKEAINEKQVDSTFQSQKDILDGIAKELQAVYGWALRMLYYNVFKLDPSDPTNSVVYRVGDNYFMHKAEYELELLSKYGAELDPVFRVNLEKKIRATQFHGSEPDRRLDEVIVALLPLRSLTDAQALDIAANPSHPLNGEAMLRLRYVNIIEGLRMDGELDALKGLAQNDVKQRLNQLIIDYDRANEIRTRANGKDGYAEPEAEENESETDGTDDDDDDGGGGTD